MLITHLTTTSQELLDAKNTLCLLCNHMMLRKAWGQGEGEGSCFYFSKSKLQKAFVSHCMEFLAVFHSQCLSAGTRLESEQEKQEYNLWDGAETQKMLLFIQRETEDANT